MEFYWDKNGRDLMKKSENGNIHVAAFFVHFLPLIYNQLLFDEAKALWEKGELSKPIIKQCTTHKK